MIIMLNFILQRREMFNCEKSRDLAVTTFKENKHIYHPIAAKKIAKDLKLV